MRFRSTFILLAVFAALGAYVYFAEYRGHDAREEQTAAKKKLFPTPLKDVVELTLVYPDRKVAAKKKDETHWEITEPQGIEADSDEWEMLASSLNRIEKEDTVATGGDLAPFGLDKPAVDVSAKLKDGKSVRVLFGAENPKKTQNYAKLGDSQDVFLSPSSGSKSFQKSLTDLRDKKLLKFAAEDISSIRIEDAKTPLELQKSGTDWVLKTSGNKADGAEVSGFLNSVQSAKAVEFAAETVDAKSAGLNPPAARLILHDGKANADRVLQIGKSPEPDKYYVKDESRPAVMLIDKELPDKIRRPQMDWVDKTIAHVEPDKVDEIELVRGAEKLSLKKEGADWKLADGRKVQAERVSNVLSALEFERASQVLGSPGKPSEYGLDRPRLELTFRQSGKDLLALKFGSVTKNPDGTYLKVSTNASVMVVSPELFEKLSLKAGDIVEKQPVQ